MLQAQYGFLFNLQQIHWLYYAEGLLIVTILLIVVISLLTKAPAKETIVYTTYGATPEEKAATRASWDVWDVVHTVIILGIVGAFYFMFW
jgi:SSS family solute:Na+ symporter